MKRYLSIIACVILTIGCQGKEIVKSPKENKHAAVEWAYTGAKGPLSWGNLSPDYKLCATGKRQSPIDILGGINDANGDSKLNYRVSNYTIINNGHSVQVNSKDKNSALTINSKMYILQQFHFHSPSEHRIQGKTADMGLHLVHTSVDGSIAVIGVLIEQGDHNSTLAKIFNTLPENKITSYDLNNFNINQLLPTNHSNYRYEGSLTTPPCTEGVQWIILNKPITASKAQIAQFRAIISDNYRPVQPINGREIHEFSGF